MVKNYIFAGIDFIIDKENKIYFIEANSSPGALKEYEALYKNCRPVKELCKYLNKKYKKLAVITKKKWNKTFVFKEFKKRFKGKIYVCYYEKNKNRLLKGNGSLIDRKGRKITPDAVLRVNGKPYAQEKAGIKVINPICVLNLTIDKVKTKEIIKKYTKLKVPKAFIINKKSDIKRILNKNKKLFSKGFVLKPSNGQKSEDVFVFYSYNDIPKKFKVNRRYLIEELIHSSTLFRKEFFEIRSMAVNGKYAGGMLFVSPKRPMHLFTEGRAVKIPRKLENKIKRATEIVVKAIDKHSS